MRNYTDCVCELATLALSFNDYLHVLSINRTIQIKNLGLNLFLFIVKCTNLIRMILVLGTCNQLIS